MDLNLWENIALVTRGNRRIGLATAKGLAKEGCEVAICARREGTVAPTAEQVESLGHRVGAFQAWRSRQ